MKETTIKSELMVIGDVNIRYDIIKRMVSAKVLSMEDIRGMTQEILEGIK